MRFAAANAIAEVVCTDGDPDALASALAEALALGDETLAETATATLAASQEGLAAAEAEAAAQAVAFAAAQAVANASVDCFTCPLLPSAGTAAFSCVMHYCHLPRAPPAVYMCRNHKPTHRTHTSLSASVFAGRIHSPPCRIDTAADHLLTQHRS